MFWPSAKYGWGEVSLLGVIFQGLVVRLNFGKTCHGKNIRIKTPSVPWNPTFNSKVIWFGRLFCLTLHVAVEKMPLKFIYLQCYLNKDVYLKQVFHAEPYVIRQWHFWKSPHYLTLIADWLHNHMDRKMSSKPHDLLASNSFG